MLSPFIVLPFIILSSIAVYFGTRMPKQTVVTFSLLAIYAYLVSPGYTFFTFVTAALVLGASKYLSRREGKTDLNKYKPQNFLYATIPALTALSAGSFLGQTQTALILAASGLAAIVSDTVATDFGITHGKKAFLVTNGRAVAPGTDGAVSVIGTVAGILATAVFAAIAAVIGTLDFVYEFLIIFLTGNLGNLVDSYLGATIQARGFLNNEQVNFVSSSVAIIAVLVVSSKLFLL